MKSVLISIQPKYCELIASDKKTIEVRKTAPKLKTPFKCYIYCTGGRLLYKNVDQEMVLAKSVKYYGQDNVLNGKVIGEFICDKIEMVNAQCSDIGIDLFYHDCEEYGCLSQVEVEKYFGVYDEEQITDLRSMKGNGYAWHISDQKIYDKPKKLYEFFVKGTCEEEDLCSICKHYYKGNEWSGSEPDCDADGVKPLTRPPQSWCYVEEL